jgi:hypothetical protein
MEYMKGSIAPSWLFGKSEGNSALRSESAQ